MSLWTIGDHGLASMDEDFEGDPQLLCDIKHDGDVLDLQVSSHLFLILVSHSEYLGAKM